MAKVGPADDKLFEQLIEKEPSSGYKDFLTQLSQSNEQDLKLDPTDVEPGIRGEKALVASSEKASAARGTGSTDRSSGGGGGSRDRGGGDKKGGKKINWSFWFKVIAAVGVLAIFIGVVATWDYSHQRAQAKAGPDESPDASPQNDFSSNNGTSPDGAQDDGIDYHPHNQTHGNGNNTTMPDDGPGHIYTASF